MRRLLAALAVVLSLLCPVALPIAAQPTAQSAQDPKTQTVFITRTGKKCHRDGCRYFASSKIPISLKDAKATGFTACKVCRPAEQDGSGHRVELRFGFS